MKTVIRNARIVNEGQIREGDLLIQDGRIGRIGSQINAPGATEIDAGGLYLMPGIIDDQVHFREPGLTHKACIATESAAAAAGGVTSFMDMPNVKPPSLTQELLEARYQIAATDAWVNYSFYMGVSNDNLEEVLKTDREKVCGLKIFMGSSTGNMLVDNDAALDAVFSATPLLIAVHCEDEQRIRERTAQYIERYGEDIPMRCHPEIRDAQACLLSSSKAVSLARRYGTRLHILHLTTATELDLFPPGPVASKQITSEVCVHHLFFDDSRYDTLGSQIKCNPAIKSAADRDALKKALVEGRLDVVATDHAPHTLEEKAGRYLQAPSGLPLIQHSLNLLLEVMARPNASALQTLSVDPAQYLSFAAEKMSHAVADCFRIRDRGYLREGYFADFFLFDPSLSWQVNREDLLYRCGWSPLEGQTFSGRITSTWVNGKPVWDLSKGLIQKGGKRLLFA